MHVASLPRLTFRDRSSLLETSVSHKNCSKDSNKIKIDLSKAKNRKYQLTQYDDYQQNISFIHLASDSIPLKYYLEEAQKNAYIERIRLIRKIGDLMKQDNRSLSAKRKKMKRKVNAKYKQFNRNAEKLMNLVNQQGNPIDGIQMKKLKQVLK